MLAVEDLTLTYRSGHRVVPAIDGMTFTVAEGELAAMVGPSGCGKTTLLRCIAGLLAPSSGRVAIRGEAVDGPPPGLGVVFQDYSRSLLPWMTVQANIELPLRSKSMARERRRGLVEHAVASVGLSHALERYPWELSGGMQQRVAIARALAFEPSLLLMDEPFASVDAQTRGDLEDLLLAVRREYGVTILLVTHDVDESVFLGDRVIVLDGSPTRVRAILEVELPEQRDQVTTKGSPRFAELRAEVYRQIKGAAASR